MFDYFHWKCLTSYIPGSLLAFHSRIVLVTQSSRDQVIPDDPFFVFSSFQLMRPLV